MYSLNAIHQILLYTTSQSNSVKTYFEIEDIIPYKRIVSKDMSKNISFKNFWNILTSF